MFWPREGGVMAVTAATPSRPLEKGGVQQEPGHTGRQEQSVGAAASNLGS